MTAYEDLQLYQRYNHLLNDQEFLSFGSNVEKMEHILANNRPIEVFREEIRQIVQRYRSDHIKSMTKNLDYRLAAKEWMEKSNYKMALNMCNRAILSAPFPTKVNSFANALSQSFALKSMTEFQMENYSNSLFSANCSLELFQTIEMLLQKVNCLKILHRYEEAIKILDQLIDKSVNDRTFDMKDTTREDLRQIKGLIINEMSKKDPQVCAQTENMIEDKEKSPDGHFWIHPSCDLTSNSKKGRFFVAIQFMSKGTTVLVEEPISSVIAVSEQLFFCSNCRERLDQKFWPCHGCDELVFCNEKCYREANQKFHQYECGFAGFICGHIGQSYLHVFRLISRYGIRRAIDWESEHKTSDFKKYISSENSHDFDCLYEIFTSLLDNSSHCDPHTIVHQGFKSIKTALLLEFAFRTELDRQLLAVLSNICFVSSQRVNINLFGMSVFEPKRKNVGGCVCLVSALFNHSCDYNVHWTLRNNRMVITAVKDINVGDELTLTYGPTIRNKSFFERQIDLKSKYNFICSCKACLRDCRSYLTFRCHYCSGPVIRNLPQKSNMTTKKAHCLECGKKFKKLKKFVARLKASKKMFEKSMKDLENEFNTSVSLMNAEQSLNALLNVVYPRSVPLLEYVIKMMSTFRNHNHFEDAIKYGQIIERAIDLELKDSHSPTPTMVFEYLLFFTDSYYKYLRGGQISDKTKWNQCFQMYAKLLQLLEQNKSIESEEYLKLKKKEEMNDKESGEKKKEDKEDVVEEDEDEEEERKERIILFSEVLHMKNEELTELQKKFKEVEVIAEDSDHHKE